MSVHEQTTIDPALFQNAVEQLKLHTPTGYDSFFDDLRAVYGGETGTLTKGFSRSTFRDMKAGNKNYPSTLPYGIVEALYRKGHDISDRQVLDFFHKLGFDIRLDCGCARNNEDPSRFTLEDLRFEIHEADAVADDPENPDFELELKIGFDRLRLTVMGDDLKTEGNFIACETSDTPEAEGISDADGWFKMRLVSTDPLSWVFEPKQEGRLLSDVVKVKGKVAEVSTSGAAPVAIISALREAMKVRITDPIERRAPKTLIDEHRDRMCAAVAQRSLGQRAPEYVLHSVRL